jgi:hypothetical protein
MFVMSYANSCFHPNPTVGLRLSPFDHPIKGFVGTCYHNLSLILAPPPSTAPATSDPPAFPSFLPSPSAMGVPLTFKNDRGAALDFADEVVRHELTKEFQRAAPKACRGLQYKALQRTLSAKLSKVESTYVGALYCSTMQKLLLKGWVYAKDETTGELRKIFSEELLVADPSKAFLHREWKQENRCVLWTSVRADLAAARVPTITVITEKGSRWKVRQVVWNQVHLTEESEAAFAGAQAGSPEVGVGASRPPCVSPSNLAKKAGDGGLGDRATSTYQFVAERRSALNSEDSYNDGPAADDEDDGADKDKEVGEDENQAEGEEVDYEYEQYYEYERKEAQRWILQGENRALQQELSTVKEEFQHQLDHAMDEAVAWRSACKSANEQIDTLEKVLDEHVHKNEQHVTKLTRKHEAEKAEQAEKHELEKAETKKRELDLHELQEQLERSNKRLRLELDESGAKCRGLEAELAELKSERLPQGRGSILIRFCRRMMWQGGADMAGNEPEPQRMSDPTQSLGRN